MSSNAATTSRWWDRPILPFLVLTVTPVLILVLGRIILDRQPDCGEDEPGWELRHFQLALLPALADFLPFVWLASRAPGVRRAALVAGLLGAARYAIVQAETLDYSMSFPRQSDCTTSIFLLLLVVPTILVLWLVPVLIVAVMHFRARAKPAA